MKFKITNITIAVLIVMLNLEAKTEDDPMAYMRSAMMNALKPLALDIAFSHPIDLIRLAKAKEDYMKAIGLDAYGGSTVGGANQGLELYNIQKVKNLPCLANLAVDFYSEIFAESTKRLLNTKLRPFGGKGDTWQPTLGDEAGTGSTRDLAPGWLWEKALRFSDGDPNLAIFLIGICGHDDAVITNSIKGVSIRSEIREKMAKRFQEVRELLVEQMTYGNENDSEKYYDLLKEVIPRISNTETIACNISTANFFVAKSLGSNVDISSDLKKELAKKLTPDSNMTRLPSKHYHIYSGASMGCLLRQHGISVDSIVKVQGLASNLYRSARLCEHLRNNDKDAEKLYKRFAKFLTGSEKDPCSDIEKIYGRLRALGSSGGNKTEYELSASAILPIHMPPKEQRIFDPCHGLSKKRCQAAIETIGKWEINMRWTREQHEVGARFGAKVCKPNKDKESFTFACKQPGSEPKSSMTKSQRGAK